MDIWTIGSTGSEKVFDYLLARSATQDETLICFDYFDTLVTRTVYPEYTKEMASTLLSLACGGLVEAGELYKIRSDLEREMCEQRAETGGELEFYLLEFAPRYLDNVRESHQQFFRGWETERFTELLLDIELTVETSVQQPLAEVAGVLRKLRQRGIKTVLISDFYLPASHYFQMLAHHGFTELFDHVFVSADYGLAKGSGRLYGKVCEQVDCRPDQLVMIGDNHLSDVEMAREQGIESLHVRNPRQQEYYQTWKADNKKPEQEFEKSLSALPEATVFREMAHSLYFFIYKLFRKLAADGAKEVFFFSKEGEFLKRLFERFQTDLFGRQLIVSHYLLASRKATFLASLGPLPEENFTRLFNHYRDISCRDFLLSLNLEESLAKEICTKAGLDFETRISNFPQSTEFNELKNSTLFQSVYEQRRLQQRENFIYYLDSFGLDFRQQGLTIVDVGWKGSIQDNIYHILEGKVEIRGYYVGSLIASERRKTNSKQGLLFDDTPALTPYFHAYNNNRSLFEMVLGASHGSADGYYTSEQFENLGDDHRKVVGKEISANPGALHVATLDLPEERTLFKEVIAPLQGALFEGFVSQIRTYLGTNCSLPEPRWFAEKHARMVFTPRDEEIEFFERLYHLENFGVFEYTNFQTGEGLPLGERLKNLKEVIQSKTLLESGVWPPIILRRLGVGFYRHIDGYRRYRRVFKQAES
ncbi:HAD-IA family hydrolase [Thermodesulfobacteriota bacterium]